MRALRFALCDVFTDVPLAGNPLAVFTDGTGVETAKMQALAREFNFSETVFVERPREGGHFRLRIFTPRQEVPFAGHPTLGAALVVGRSVQLNELRIETQVGIISVTLDRDGGLPNFGWMVQPVPQVRSFSESTELCAALGIPGSSLPIQFYDNGIRHVLVGVASAEVLANLRPNLSALAGLPVDTIVVFSADGDQAKVRVFAPGAGVPEDPATGSAAGPLALHLRRAGILDAGVVLNIQQGQELGRPSRLSARIIGDPLAPERVEVGGAGVLIGRGEILI